MKKIFVFLLFLQGISFAQTRKSEWSIFTPEYTYDGGSYSGRGNPFFSGRELIILGDQKYVFAPFKTGPLTFYEKGNAYSTSATHFAASPKTSILDKISTGMTEDVTALYRDINGNIWLGAVRGLLYIPKEVYSTLPQGLENKLTDTKCTLIKDETPGMPFKSITGIAGDNRGFIWVAGYKEISLTERHADGISRFNGNEWKHFKLTDPKNSDKELSELFTIENKLYGLVGHKDIFMFDGISWSFYESPSNDGIVRILKPNKQGVIYAATTNNLYYLDKGSWVKIAITNFDGPITTFAFDENSIWIGSENNGVYQIRSSGLEENFNQSNSPLPANNVWKIEVDENNKKWFFTTAGWAGYKEPSQSNERVQIMDRYTSNYKFEFVEDAIINKDKTYFVTTDAGLVAYDGKSFNKIPTKLETSYTSIATDKNGKLYMGTSKYLNTVDGNKSEKWELRDQEGIAKQINDVLIDDKDQIWLAHNKGVSKYDGSSWQHFDKKTGLTSNQATILFQDSKKNIWLITNDGISKYDGSAWENFTKKTVGFTVGNMKGVGEDSGKILFSNGWSLVEYDGTTLKEVPSFKRIDGGINHFAVDKHGNLWFASVNKGVIKLANNVMTYYTTADGIPSDNINRILISGNEVWASSGYVKPHEFTSMPPIGSSTTTQQAPPKPTEKEIVEKKIKDFEPQFALFKIKE